MKSLSILIYDIQFIKKSKNPLILMILILYIFADCNIDIKALNNIPLTKLPFSPENAFLSK